MIADSATKLRSIVVVGNGPVGFMFCRNLTKHPQAGLFDVTVFGEEPRAAYDRIRLTDLFSGTTEHQLEFGGRDWYQRQNVTLHTGDRVVEIDRQRKLVRSESGKEIHYDHLVLATGSRAFVPPIAGADLPGVYVYRTIDDVLAIQAAAKTSRSAVVLGGGLLGLEAAKALLDSGLETHLVEQAPVLMPKQLDSNAADILVDLIRKTGVNVHLLKRTDRIESQGDQLSIQFNDGETLTADLVVVSAGIRPRDELAKSAGLEIADTHYGGIIVNDHLRTNDPDISAIGECVIHREQAYGLAGPGYYMAEVLAKNLAGESAIFEGGDLSTRLKVLDIDVSLCGDYLDISQAHTEVYSTADVYRKLVIRDQEIVGLVSVGESPELPWLQAAINEQRKVGHLQLQNYRKEGLLWPNETHSRIHNWPSGAVVCSCMGITRGNLGDALANGCDTVALLAEKTRASTVCGSCQPLLAELVGEPIEVEKLASRHWLLGASVATFLVILVLIFKQPITVADSVQNSWHQITELWRDTYLRRITGFTVLGITALTLLLSVRKRLGWFQSVSFGTWRVIHAVLGVLALVGIGVHTGFSWGTNLNFWLMFSFLGASFIGAATASIASWEADATGSAAQWIRVWRPRLTLVHIFLCWPLPVLIAFHIVMTFYF